MGDENNNDETEIIVIDNGFRPFPHVYHFEDFFWTGSGDGGTNDNTVTVTKHWSSSDQTDNEIQPTVYLTSTVTSTVIITRTSGSNKENDENSTKCMHNNCDERGSESSTTLPITTVVRPILPAGTTINPTKTSEWDTTSTTPRSSTTEDWWKGDSERSTTTTNSIITSVSDEEHEVNTITILVDTHRYQTPDRRYWIITILEDTISSGGDDSNQNGTNNVHNTLPPLEILENRLAILYHIAFYRQQQKHLGIQNNNRSKRSSIGHRRGISSSQAPPAPELYTKKRSLQKINVQIHNISKHIDNNDLELVYSVRVAGQPVPAKTAAADMRLVTNQEVVKQLGPYTVKTKAEPYLRDESQPLGLARYENTWLFIGTAIGILIILIILLIIIIFGIQHRSKTKNKLNVGQSSKSIITDNLDNNTDDNDIIIQPVLRPPPPPSSSTNLNYKMEDAEVQTCGRITNYKTISTFGKAVRNIHVAPSISSVDSTSSSDTAGGSISESSPVAPRAHQRYRWKNVRDDLEYHHHHHRHHDRNTNVQEFDDYDGGYKEVVDATNIVAIRRASVNTDVRSAHSYLSMPSVKNFPRGSIPEPLSRVLEPVSIRHLDDGMITPIESPIKTPRQHASQPHLTRHGSMQEAEDPGVIGPLVWNQHCQKLNQAIEKEPTNEPPNVGRMKKRFQELLDDAFSLFGSRSVSPEDYLASTHTRDAGDRDGGGATVLLPSTRAHSAYPRLSSVDDNNTEPPIQQRPKTSDPRRKSSHQTLLSGVGSSGGYIEPRCAWASTSSGGGAPSPLIRRALSAGAFHRPTLAPHICPVRILPEGRLDTTDTAVPVIEAIKDELRKCGQTIETPRQN